MMNNGKLLLMNKFILLFFIYSMAGWLLETTYVSIQNKKLISRGFLFGPICPIYGIGILLLIICLISFKDNLITLTLLIPIICTLIEYLISYFMEKIFRFRWWDYSNKKYNINGRICLENTIYFTIVAILIIKYLHPFLLSLINKIPEKYSIIISIILCTFLLIDATISTICVLLIKKKNHDINKDSTIIIKKEINKLIK